MKKNIEFVDDKQAGIIFRKFNGEVGFDEVYSSWQQIINDYLLLFEYKGIVNDLCEASLKMNLDDLKTLLEYFTTHETIFERLKIAVITLSPNTIVLPIYAAQNYPKLRIRAFSTQKAAEDWIYS